MNKAARMGFMMGYMDKQAEDLATVPVGYGTPLSGEEYARVTGDPSTDWSQYATDELRNVYRVSPDKSTQPPAADPSSTPAPTPTPSPAVKPAAGQPPAAPTAPKSAAPKVGGATAKMDALSSGGLKPSK
jgi:hypothetical protein